MSVVLLAMVLGLVAAGVVVAVAYHRWPRASGGLAVLGSATCFGWVVAQLDEIAAGGAVALTMPWVPSLGVVLRLRLDGLAAVVALLICGVGALVLAYAPGYMERGPRTARLLGLLLAFEASMLGLVLADDTVTLFVFWELTSFTSFFLISLDDASPMARTRARQALVVTAGGGLVLLVGLVLLAAAASPGGAAISVSLSSIAREPLQAHPHHTLIVVLVAIGAFTKSAQVPFHFWLPGAMVAPAPVSAYLHSATMVKAGIYVLARLQPTLGGGPIWTSLLVTVGTVTFVAGAVLAIVQRDVKLSLAYATVAVLGALTLLLGIGTPAALGGALVLLLAHACYKAALFLTAGNLDHHRGTRDPFAPRDDADMPRTALAAGLAAASMAGIPPLLGFVAKDAVLAATLGDGSSVTVTIAAVVAGACLVTCGWLAGVAPFWRGRRSRRHDDVHGAMAVIPLVLAGAGVVLGLVPTALGEPLIGPALAAIAGRPVTFELALWPGLHEVHGLAFALGLASIAAGAAGAVLIERHQRGVSRLRAALERGAGGRVHEAVLDRVVRGASWLTRLVQHQRLPRHIGTVVALALAVVLLPLVLGSMGPVEPVGWKLGEDTVLLAVASLAACATALFRERMAAVASLSVVGLAVTFLFALYSGPDLAITQLAVETMMVILLVLAFRRLPPSATRGRAHASVPRLALAAGGGAVMTILLVLVTSTEGGHPDAARGQIALSPGQEHANVVNAILVSFRALDTLGEITVLAIAGIGVAALAGAQRRRL